MIHPLSVVHEGSTVGASTVIEPFAHVHDDVIIGEGCWIASNSVLMPGTRLGDHCKIFPGAVLGAEPQDLKFGGEKTYLTIGDHTTIREFCTLNRATSHSTYTKIGSHCLLMAYVHVAHDCSIGDHCVLANSVNMAGHVLIDDYVIIGGMVPIHQFVNIGKHSMVGGGSLVRKDVPPFIKAAREPLSYVGINSIGLNRRGFTKGQVNCINDIYRLIYVSGYNMSQAIEEINVQIEDCDEKTEILKFITNSERGLIRGYNG